jgi:hypothetical protein
VELVSHMLDQVRLKNGCETSRYLIDDRWSNNGSVIVIIVAVVSLIVVDHVVQDDASTHDQIENELRVRSIRDG